MIVGQGPIALAVGAGVFFFCFFFHIFTLLYLFSSFSLSLGNGPIWTEKRSQRAFKPQTTNQPKIIRALFIIGGWPGGAVGLGKLPVPGRPTNLKGWSGGAMVLGKLLVLGRPAYLDYSRARAYCAYSRCGWGGLDVFSLIYHFSFLSPSLWETARYRLKYCLKDR